MTIHEDAWAPGLHRKHSKGGVGSTARGQSKVGMGRKAVRAAAH
jgi:hypothetical protein